jgi:hypothetical protein
MKANYNNMNDSLIREACLGFSGPEDQVVSLVSGVLAAPYIRMSEQRD